MSNFAFVRQALPAVYDDCARAESYATTDPRAACFYARRAVERTVDYLYGVLDLTAPYRDDLAAKLASAPFAAVVPQCISQKMGAIRRLANTAVHDDMPIPLTAATAVLRELLHIVIWVAYHHSPHPEAVPLTAQFDPSRAAFAAPLSHDDIRRLAARAVAQDAAHAKDLADRDDLVRVRDAEIARLRSEIAQAQAVAKPDDRDYDESTTRTQYIDLALHEAGWPLDQQRDREYPVAGMPSQSGRGFVDYVLWGADGLPLAVVEAKRTGKSPEAGQQQAKLYADCLEKQFGRRPVILYSNGYEHWIWDDRTGAGTAGYPPRRIAGFYTADELELIAQRRHARTPLVSQPVAGAIAGRPYQLRAIKAISDALDRKQRAALLVMATGAGKTRTAIALVDVMQRANWAKRVLFLADRQALVGQAAAAFRKHLPASTTVNLLEERATDGRVYVSTYPTMMNLIDEIGSGTRRFGPGYFDLIVIDEAHRSVYAKYGAIFEYFDSLLVGLTATPKNQIDHNTYRLFRLEDGVPTDAYGLDEAVAAGYLVPPKGIAVGTKFLRSGIRYADLTDEERDRWDALEWGDAGTPDEVGAEELNRFLFNEDTVDKVLETLMTTGRHVAGGDRLGKTIIFAKNQRHAEFVEQRFNLAYPEYGGTFARVITYQTPYAQSLIDSFKVAGSGPHIAISVDMLDTGVDVPEVVNLVLFKTVHSQSKFWQMIGRGTRLCPDLYGPGEDKADFVVFDFCGNLEYFGEQLPDAETSVVTPLSQRIFEARVGLAAALGKREPALRATTVAALHATVAGMNRSNVVVRRRLRAVERFSDAAAWDSLDQAAAADALTLATLPSSVRDDDEDAKRYDLLVLRCQVAQLDADPPTAARARRAIQAIAAALLGKRAIPVVARQAALLDAVAGDPWWEGVTLPMLETVRLRLRGLARFVDRTSRSPVYTDFADTIGAATDVALPGITPGTDFARFRAKAEAYLRAHLDNLALQRLRRGRQLTAEDLEELEKLLIEAGGAVVDIAWAGESVGGLGIFVRGLVGMDRATAMEAFADYLDGTRFSAEQLRFVMLIVDEITSAGVMQPGRLFESPYTDHAPTGPDFFFRDADIEVIVDTLDHIRHTAIPRAVA